MRIRAAELGHEPHDALMLHEHGVGRGQIVGVDDPAGGSAWRRLLPAPALQVDLHPVDDMLDVVLARAQVRVVHRVEDGGQRIALQLEGPLRIASRLADIGDGRLRDGLVFEHQQVGVDERGDLLRRPLGDPGLHRAELEARGIDRPPEPRDLGFDLRRIQRAFGDLRPATVHRVHPPDRDALGGADAVYGERHRLQASPRPPPRRNRIRDFIRAPKSAHEFLRYRSRSGMAGTGAHAFRSSFRGLTDGRSSTPALRTSRRRAVRRRPRPRRHRLPGPRPRCSFLSRRRASSRA